MTTLGYEIPLPGDLLLIPGVSFDQNLKVKIITIGLYKNPGQEDQKVCHWKIVPASK